MSCFSKLRRLLFGEEAAPLLVRQPGCWGWLKLKLFGGWVSSGAEEDDQPIFLRYVDDDWVYVYF